MKRPTIKKMIVTEKSGLLQDLGKYVFSVDRDATKSEIRQALKTAYKVDAVAVNTISEKPSRRRFRNRITFKQGGKKAIVTLKAGQKIDIQ